MKLSILPFLAILLSQTSCLVGDTDCCTYVGTDSINKGLYVERYKTFCAGVFGERIDHYLTDSSNFRTNVGWNDEHNFLLVSRDNDIIRVYKCESVLLEDTLCHKVLSKKDLLKYKDSGAATKNSIPLFGKNPLDCNESYYFSSFKIENEFYFTSDQYKCGNTFINANYLTDSLNFRLLIGFYDFSGSDYKVNVKNDSIDFYEVQSKTRRDTFEVKSLKYTELMKQSFRKPCAN